MKLRGQDTVDAIREWFKEEVKKAPAVRMDLGKFFFGVSTASMGVVVGFKKLGERLSLDWTTAASLLLLGVSSMIAMLMTTP